jgi:hypothetical protein
MVYGSPAKRSVLGSISSILNTTPETPRTKQGRVGKIATPRVAGIRQKLANLFGVNKENSPRKMDLRQRQKHLPDHPDVVAGKVCLFVVCFDLIEDVPRTRSGT